MLLLLIYYTIFTPFNTAFLNIEDSVKFFLYIGAIQDLIFIFDMCICFITAYIDDQERLEVNFRTISASYIKSWFIVDLFGCFPSDIILLLGIS